MSFTDIVSHEYVLAWQRGERLDTATAEQLAADRILTGYRSLEEATEIAEWERARGSVVMGCDTHGYWITPAMVLEAVEVKKRASPVTLSGKQQIKKGDESNEPLHTSSAKSR